MKATSLDQIFKTGDNFEFKKIDYSSDEVTKNVKQLKEKQKRILKEAEVDIEELRKIKFV